MSILSKVALGVVVALVASQSVAAGAPKYFRSPTGNIICGWVAAGEFDGSQALICATYNDSFGVVLRPTGPARSRYLAENTLPERPGAVLRYGRTWLRGAYRCSMDRLDGVICESLRSGHGFQLNRTHFTRFRR